MSQPLGYYTGYEPETLEPKILYHLQDRYGGGQLRSMTYEQKIVFRAALSVYVAEKPVWQHEGSSITCIDCCIESAGVDWNVWDEDAELVKYIQACSELSESDIEGLIEAVTAQIRSHTYVSRIG